VDGTFGDDASHFLRRRWRRVHQLVALHVLLAAETFSTDVAMVEGGGVASLVNVKVVRF